MFATGVTMGLAELVIDDTCLVLVNFVALTRAYPNVIGCFFGLRTDGQTDRRTLCAKIMTHLFGGELVEQ